MKGFSLWLKTDSVRPPRTWCKQHLMGNRDHAFMDSLRIHWIATFMLKKTLTWWSGEMLKKLSEKQHSAHVPKSTASAGPKGRNLDSPIHRERLGKPWASLQTKRPRGNTINDFQRRKCCCEEKRKIWFMEHASNSNRQKLQHGE